MQEKPKGQNKCVEKESRFFLCLDEQFARGNENQ